MKKSKRHQTNLISNIIILVTVGLIVVLGIMLYNHVKLETRFYTLINWLTKIDNAVANLDSHTEIIICIFALYIAKCQLPIPLSFLCVISGMVFPINQAIIINVICILFFFTVKYIEGMWIGGGWAGMILNIKKIKFIRDWIHFKGNGNPYVLFVTRLIPFIPLGMVSKYYGSMKYDYIYSKLGAAFTNPFSAQFLTLLIIIVAFSGITSLVFNIFYGRKMRQMTQTLLIYSEKGKYKIVL